MLDTCRLQGVQPDRQRLIPAEEVRAEAHRLLHDFDIAETLHDLLQKNSQLYLRQPIAHAAVNTETK